MPGDKNWEVLCHGTLENWFSPLCLCLSIYEQYKSSQIFWVTFLSAMQDQYMRYSIVVILSPSESEALTL